MGLRPPWQAWTCLTAPGLRTTGLRPLDQIRFSSLPASKRVSPRPVGLRSLSLTAPRLTPGRGQQSANAPTATSAPVNPDQPTKAVSEKNQAKADWRIILQLARNVWPKNSPGVRIRVAGALGLLVAGKLLNVQVPFFFKQIVDSLNVPITESTTVWVLAGASIAGCESTLYKYGLSRLTIQMASLES